MGKRGVDKNNNPILGRTWVTNTLTWIESDGDTLDIIAGESRSHCDFSGIPNSGFIYVMRSASDKKDIYKIGLTRRTTEQRALEISRSSGVPTEYLVVEDWSVVDCVLAEGQIHQELAEYRINNRREFFRAPYKVIRKCVEKVVDEINASIT